MKDRADRWRMNRARSGAEVHLNGRFFGSPRTGVQRVAHELVMALDDHLARTGDREIVWRLIHPEGADLPRLRVIVPEQLPGLPGLLWEQISLAKRSRGHILVNLANTAPLSHSETIVMIHDAQVHVSPDSYSVAFRGWYRFLQPRITRRAARLLTVSRFSANELAQHGLVPRVPAVVIPNGVDHILRVSEESNALGAFGLAGKPFLLGFASAQVHKNVELLLRVKRDDRLADLELALIGRSMPPNVVPPPGVRLLGRVDDSQLRMLYSHCLGFLFPSTTEGFGLPPGEAMLCGAPVIAARAGALPEFYDGAAELLPTDDDEAWIRAIIRLSADPDWRMALADRGQRRAETMGWSAAAEELANVISRVRDERAGPL